MEGLQPRDYTACRDLCRAVERIWVATPYVDAQEAVDACRPVVHTSQVAVQLVDRFCPKTKVHVS